MEKEEANKCVYFHINPLKNCIFYVGMGSIKRPYVKSGRSNHWKAVTKKYGYIVNIVEENLTEKEAFEREKFYINKIGLRKLVNLTEGGKGLNGNKWVTEEIRRKMKKLKPHKNYIKKVKIKKDKSTVKTAAELRKNGETNGILSFKCKKVYQFSLEGKVLNIFNSQREAASFVGAHESHISRAVREQGTCCKFIWGRTENDYPIILEKLRKDYRQRKFVSNLFRPKL